MFTMGEGFGGITCTTATFTGTVEGTYQSGQTITPTYAGCKDSFGRTVHVVTDTLQYRFTSTGTEPDGTPAGTTHVSGHMELTITTGPTHCTITIKGAQTNNGITYHNVAPGQILTTTSISNLASTTHGEFFACGISNGEHKTGTYVGSTK